MKLICAKNISDPQVFLNWLHNMDRYFTRYSLSELEKVRFVVTKLTRQASQYWIDVVKKRVPCGQEPILGLI